MKKLVIFILVFVITFCSHIFAEPIGKMNVELKDYTIEHTEDTIFVVDSKLYINDELFSSNTIDIKGKYYAKKIATVDKKISNKTTDVVTRIAYGYETYDCVNVIYDYKDLYFNMQTGEANIVGRDCIIGKVKWQETWLVNEYGVKLSLEYRTAPVIVDATNEYSSIPFYTVWRTSFIINTNYARTDGKVDSSKGGSQSYTHTFTARYN